MSETMAARAERLRIRIMALTLALLAAEAAGAGLLIAGHRAAGITIAAAMAVLYAAVRRVGAGKLATICLPASLERGLGLQHTELMPKGQRRIREEDLLRLLPDALAAPAHTSIYSPCSGTLAGRPAMLCEVSAVYKGNAPRPLTGTLLCLELRRPVGNALLLTGQPFGGRVRADAYASRPWQLIHCAQDTVKWLVPKDRDPAPLRAVFARQDPAPLGNAAVLLDGTVLTALLPGSFYSGFWPLNQPVTEQKFKANPLPQAAALVLLADHLEEAAP